MLKQVFISLLVTFVFINLLKGQSTNSAVDSLKQEILFSTDSVQKVNLLFDLARELSKNRISEKQANIYLDEMLSLSTKIGYAEGLIKYYDLSGHYDRNKGAYASALQKHIRAMHLAEENGLKEYLPRIYNNIGVIYRRIDEFSSGIEYHLKALRIAEELGDNETIGYACNSIGNIYSLMKQYDKALSFFNRSLDLAQMGKNTRSKAINFNNIGEVYEFMGDYQKALEYYSKSLELNIEINNIKGLGISYDCIGNVYRKTNQFTSALEYYKKGAEMHLKHSETLFYSVCLKNIGSIYLNMGDYVEAEKNINISLEMAKKVGSKTTIGDLYDLKAQLCEKQHNFQQALLYERIHSKYVDSVWNEQNSLNITKLQTIYDTEKQLEAISKLNIENQLNEKIIERKNILNLTLSVFIGLILIFALILYRGYKIKQRNNAQLKHQANLITRKNNALEKQKKKIELINTRITDSLNYAQRIQQALLPVDETLTNLFKEHFVVFMPLDVVSGDFYWVASKNDKLMFVTADCTGHGVPGALMSMLGISFLNELAQRNDMTSAADYLNKLRELVIKSLKQKGNYREIKDGISLSFCIYDKKNSMLQFSGAQSTIIVANQNTVNKEYSVETYKGDNMPIGYYQIKEPFKNHLIPTHSLDTLYLFTDGFIDQFGGSKGRRFKKQTFLSLIEANIDKPLSAQKEIIEQEFIAWKKDREQIDDVLIFAVKFK